MGFYLSPGVYLTEKDLSDIIPTIATTKAAIVGESKKGPIDEPVLITNTKQFVDYFGEPEPGNYFHYSALAYLEHGNQLYAIRAHNGALYGGIRVKFGSGEDAEAVVAGVTETVLIGNTYAFDDSTECMLIVGANPGEWNDNIAISITNVDESNHFFTIDVYYTDEDGNQSKVESWRVSRVQDKVDGYGKNAYVEEVVNAQSMYIRILDNTDVAETVDPEECTLISLDHGDDGTDVTTGIYVTAWDTWFSNPDLYSVNILINAGWCESAEQLNLVSIAEDRKDCIAILDIPYGLTVTQMLAWRNTSLNTNSSYAAIYADWVEIYDSYNDKVLYVPPSGYVASQYAYNDYVENAAFAPAGLNRGKLNVLDVATVFTRGQLDALYEAEINPIRYMPEGIAIWGQKTMLQLPGSLDRVNVRRILIVIETAITVALRGYVFEPNDTLTRLQVTQMIENYLQRIKSQRGLYDYKVVCDETNNTAATIDANELYVDIYLKPTKAAEFIRLQTIITRTGASFDELAAVI